MRNVLYLNNYMSEEVIEVRNNKSVFSQPANNKITGILLSLLAFDCRVTILSSGLVNSKSLKIYKKLEGEKCHTANVIYCRIFDFPFLNTLSSIFFMYREIKKLNRKEKIDNIIFYNYKPEVAWAAYMAKKNLGIPITVEYEDGYTQVEDIKGVKAWIFKSTEEIVSQKIDSAIVVNDKVREKYRVPAITVRGVVNPFFLNECKSYYKEVNDQFTILYSGGLDRSRGVQVLLDSLQYLKIDCHIVITGKGSVVSEDKRVDFKGFVPYEETLYWMKQADLLVQCQLVNDSFADVSFPSKLFEYIATGNYIISSAITDVYKFAGDDLIYYENDDPEMLGKRIEEVYLKWKKGEYKSASTERLCIQNMPEQVGKRIVSLWGK